MTFLDLIFILFYCFVSLFAVTLVQVRIEQEQSQEVKNKAEYYIKVSWPYDSDDDIDTYVEDPLGHLVCFKRYEDGLLFLDRDDRGSFGETLQFGGETIRGIIPGEYVVNLHAYYKRVNTPTPVEVEIVRLNPQYKTKFKETFVLNETREELTAVRFTLDKEGSISNINQLQGKYFTRALRQE